MNTVFIAGTDTGAGKTVVTGLIGRYLLQHGVAVVTQKWVQTGCSRARISADIRLHDRIMGRKGARREIEREPYVFRAACSPHLAARFQRRRIDPRAIQKKCARLQARYDCVVVEGAGGILVPFTERVLLIDMVGKMRLPVVLVVNNKLGAINHTLLSLEALAARKIKILGLIFNNCSKEKAWIAGDNPRIIRKFAGVPVLGVLPYERDFEKLYERFMPIGKKLIDLKLGNSGNSRNSGNQGNEGMN